MFGRRGRSNQYRRACRIASKRNAPLVCGRHACVPHAVNFEARSYGHYAWETMRIALASALYLPRAPLLASFVDAHGHSPLVQLTLWKGEGLASRKMPVDRQQAESLLTGPPAWRQRLHKSVRSPFLGWCVSRKSNSLRLFIYFVWKARSVTGVPSGRHR